MFSDSCLLYVLVIINILSTPIANIKNGTTSKEIIVNPIYINDISPIEHKTDVITTKQPAIPNTIPEINLYGAEPIEIIIYKNIQKYEITTIMKFVLVSFFKLSDIDL